MNAIPAGVEATLLEVGFSITEIAILRRLLEYDAMTLRELAGRTGKSTGVLDQAMKKLLQKNIVKKEVINDSTKYAMTSWDAVLLWMEEDCRRKRELMARKHKNFEEFLRTVEQDKKRPEIEYVEGVVNFPKAYRKLLNCGRQLLCYEPVFCSIEDHPLRDFMAEWFRIRRQRGVFSHVITHNTPLGRRYQSRDLFEYRKTALIEEKEYPFTFEKVLCGDIVACFNYVEKRACLLRYPELASMERSMFETLWRMGTEKNDKTLLESSVSHVASSSPPLSSFRAAARCLRTLPGLRALLLDRKSMAACLGVGALSVLLAVGLL